jgi:signal transduction histidine kinase
MLRIFLPLYVCIVLFTAFNESIGDAVVDAVAPNARFIDYMKNLTSVFVFLDETLPNKPNAEWPAFLLKLSNNSNISYVLVPINTIAAPEEHKKSLQKGNVWVDNDNIYKGFKDSEYVVQIEPDSTTKEYEQARTGVNFFLYLLFAGAILGWAFWLQTRINQLAKITVAIGSGNFAQKASTNRFNVVGHLNASINKMSQQIETLLFFQKNIINTVSHELRTPLTRMKFELEYLEDIGDNKEQKVSIDSLSEDVDELDNLVAELLDYARTENKKPVLRLEKTSIKHFLQRWQLGYKTHDNGVLIKVEDVDELITSSFDEKMLTRVINNLTNNALRYAKSTINICCEMTESTINLHVDDDGPGIPGKAKEQIFSPFVQSENVAVRGMEGFGLGLAIVQQIIKLHKGNVSVADSALGGARFSISLSR